MKVFVTIKTGYTHGISGCTGEYFTTMLIKDGEITSVRWNGLFGAEYRVAEFLKEQGYKELHTSAEYGQLKVREIHKPTQYSEYELLNGGKLQQQVDALGGK